MAESTAGVAPIAKQVAEHSAENRAIAAQVAEQHQAAIDADLPLFLLIYYEHEADKLAFLSTLRTTLAEAGLPSRTYDPAHHPEHGTGKLYGALAKHGAETLNLVTGLPREEGGSRPQGAFLDYLNMHRDRLAERHLRWLLFLHSTDAEALITRAGDLWDFRHHTYWLKHRRKAGQSLWQDLPEKVDQLALPESGRQEIHQHVANVRKLVDQTPKTADRAALLLDLTSWLTRRRAQELAVETAFEGIELLSSRPGKLLADLEHELGYALRLNSQLPEALTHYQRCLELEREIGDRAGEGATLNNISQIYDAWGRYDDALETLNQSLLIRREIGDRAGEGATLNNISQIYDARGRYDDTLETLTQSLLIFREIGDRAGEAVTSWNLALEYERRGDLAHAIELAKITVEINEITSHPDLEKDAAYLRKLEQRFAASPPDKSATS